MSGFEMREGGGVPGALAHALLRACERYTRRLPRLPKLPGLPLRLSYQPSFRVSVPAAWRTVMLVLAVVTILWGALMAVAAG
ncbi:hypothetical protein [Streptomyces sp. NPDC006307]|uniref:hypothetical protein n=1 Tax=Streptomyces sp. NPDC006307 TaxID=3156748 RepID=UPI0033A961D4